MNLSINTQRTLNHWRGVHEGKIVETEENYVSIEHIFSDTENLDFLFHEVFKYFQNSHEIVQRAQKVASLFSAEKKGIKVSVDEGALVKIAHKSICELAKFCKHEGYLEYLAIVKNIKPVFIEHDNAKLLQLRKNELFGGILEVILEAIMYDSKTFSSGYSSIESAIFNFTKNSTFLTWYIGSPLIFLDIDFDDYFRLRQLGYDYAITEKNIFIMPSSNNLA